MQEPSDNPPKLVRTKRDKITQHEIDDVNKRHDRILLKAAETVREVIELGEILNGLKRRIPHGKWIPFVTRNFRFSDRTAIRYMRAADTKHELQLIEPAEFMAKIWGNQPKQLTDTDKVKKGKSDVNVGFDDDDNDDEDDDLRQHGGEGLNLFPDKGKAGFMGFKNLVATLDKEFFDSDSFTPKAKLDFINELISWLETKRSSFNPK